MLDFAYSRGMELILQLISITSTFIFLLFTINFSLKLYGEKVKIKGKLLCAACITVIYILQIVTIHALFGFHSMPLRSLILITLPDPIITLCLYYLGVKILHFSKYKSIAIIRTSTFYATSMSGLNIMIRFLFQVDREPYNYLLDALLLLLCMLLHLVIYSLISFYIKKNRTLNNLIDVVPIKKPKIKLLSTTLIITLVYMLSFLLITFPDYTILGNLIQIFISSIFAIMDHVMRINRSLGIELDNKSTYIESLSRSMDSFAEKRNEYDWLLDKFGDYIYDGDLKQMKKFHESIVGKTIITGEKVRLTKMLKQNPTLVSLLLKKLEYAEESSVAFHIPILCDLSDINMDSMDLCRVLGNLLDNAIEAASVSNKKVVEFSFKKKEDFGNLIIISNSTIDDVDIEKVSVHRFSMKTGHSGLGLTQVRNALKKYENSSVTFEYFNNVFTVYLEILPPY